MEVMRYLKYFEEVLEVFDEVFEVQSLMKGFADWSQYIEPMREALDQ